MQHSTNILHRISLALPLAFGLAIAPQAFADDPGVIEMGKQRFMENCAVCHGDEAKGGGPFVPLLKAAPSDLTTLSARNDGEFPFNRVYDMVDGRTMPLAHGTPEMPIWGGEWKRKSMLGGETEVRGRVLEMIVYLRSIQQ